MAQDNIIKIAVIGAESTGKTWLCEALAKHFNTNWVPEYAREYFNNSSIYDYSVDDLVQIAINQIELEKECIKNARNIMFCDTTLLTLYIWAELEFKRVPTFILENLNQVNYHYYLITDNSVHWQQDSQRQNKFSRDLILKMNINLVEQMKKPYTILKGFDEDRMNQALKCLHENFGKQLNFSLG